MERIETMADTIALWDKQDREITLKKWQEMKPEDCDQTLIQFIRTIALQRKGWQTINEHWMDGDILEMLSNADYDIPQVLKDIQNLIDIKVRFTKSD